MMPTNGNEVDMRQVNGRRMLSTAEAAEYLNVGVSTLRYWRHIADGTGPKSFRLGKKLVYYFEEDLEAYLLEQYEATVTA